MSRGKRGLKRVNALKQELERINEKIETALEHGQTENDLRVVVRRRDELISLIGEAAKEEARREIEIAKREARRLKQGKKKPGGNHPGNQDDDCDDQDDDDDDDDGNGGNGNGGNGDGGGHKKDCCCCCCEAKEKKPASGSSVPDATCVYVRTGTIVAAWNRGAQRWEEFDANSEVIKVSFVTGGILAVGKDKAAIFDCKLGQWLAAYDPADALVDGEGK